MPGGTVPARMGYLRDIRDDRRSTCRLANRFDNDAAIPKRPREPEARFTSCRGTVNRTCLRLPLAVPVRPASVRYGGPTPLSWRT